MQTEPNETNEYLAMSDEQIMGMSAPEPVVQEEPVVEAEPVIEPEVEPVVEPVVEPEVVEPVSPLSVPDGTEVKPSLVPETPVVTPAVVDPVADGNADPVTPLVPERVAPVIQASSIEGNQDLFDRLIGKPIRANGKDIQLNSADEVEQAVKMGLNFTKKMQAMQPHLRVVKMLENNNLLDEAQLSYLIDLSQKKPEAIQKLLHDSQFDPHTVDTDKAASYVPSNHQVSDLEMQFQSALDEVEASETGPELIFEVAKQWDDGSRQALYKDPRILVEINKQKASGVYARISGEVERRRALGDMQGASFLDAYEFVGKELQAKGLLSPPPAAVTPERVPVATRVVVPATKVVNNDKAKAASPTKVTPAPVKQDFSPLAMSDEEFTKFADKMSGRV